MITTSYGVVWECEYRSGRSSYHHTNLDINITYHPTIKEYVVWHLDQAMMSDNSAGVCLEVMSEVILDHYAAQFAPMWGEPQFIMDQAAE